MSLYKVGCCAPVVGHALEEQEYQVGVGALIATPGFIADQIEALNVEIVATDRDIWQHVQPLGDSPQMDWYINAWSPFTAAWEKFRQDKQGWLSRWWGSVLETNNKFRQKLIDLRKSYQSIGGALVTPEPKPVDEGWMHDLLNQVSGVGKFVKNVAYALLILAGGYIVFKLIVVSKGTRVGGL